MQLDTSETSPVSMNKQQEHTSFCYSPRSLSGHSSSSCGKDRQNFASNVTLYPCERSGQNHLVSGLVLRFAPSKLASEFSGENFLNFAQRKVLSQSRVNENDKCKD